MRIEQTSLAGLLLIYPEIFADTRGFFFESWHETRFRQQGINVSWVQDNHARSVRNTVRGLHFQRGRGQAKLIRCTRGAVWDVAVDIRTSSPTIGRWFACELNEDDHRLLYIPSGFAHGYAVLTDIADVLYKCDTFYEAALEGGIRWNDPDLAINWPIKEPIYLSGTKRVRVSRTIWQPFDYRRPMQSKMRLFQGFVINPGDHFLEAIYFLLSFIPIFSL